MRPSRPQAVSHSSASSLRSQKSSRYAFDPLDDPRPMPFKFPRTHHLITTTAHGVYTCGHHGIIEVFSSGSNGIVAAKRTSSVPGVLAIADDHLVILHDVQKGMRRSYRLRSEDGRIRMLRFAKDPDRLFFTTTLQNSVQAYDLERSQLLDPLFHHPSPPSVFALSSTSHLLLSASAQPPIIRLTSFLADSRSLSLRPQCSSKAVVVVEFHPERGHIFILAFADATCAAYDAAYIFRAGVRGQRGSGASAGGTGWEISHIKNLHRFGGTASQEHIHSNAELHESLTPDSALDGDQGDGIVAVGFVPGHKTTVVTVGSDRRCCVVDFAASETHMANVMYIWDTARSLTSLSILTLSPEGGSALPIAGIRDYDAARKINILAIGCEDGNVLFFDLVGTALLQQTLSPSGDRIIDVEWMEGDDWLEPSPRQSVLDMPSHRQSRRNRRSVGAVLASDRRTVSEEVVTVRDSSPAKTRARTALTRTLSAQESPLGSRVEKLIDLEQEVIVCRPSSDNQKDGPPLLKTPYPAVASHDDSSGMGDTSSSGSLGSMLRKFQFPDPPKHHESQNERVQRTGVGQIPRNNSWAADQQPHNTALRERPHNAPVGKRMDGMGEGIGKPPPIADVNAGGPRYEAMISKSSASDVPFEPDRAAENNEYDSRFGMVKASDQAGEDLWTDVVPDVSAYDQIGEPRLVNKENSPSRNDSNAVNLNPDGLTDPRLTGERTPYRASRRQREPGTSIAIHIDDVDQPDHPQPLSAHPGKLPSSGPRRPPLVPTNMNSSHKASAARTPWYRQRHKTGNSESHRSSIYGPGALARKVKQEVMITVNVELDVLRREMSGRFTDQTRWFEKELRKSQEWTLRVEEENRKLREEMAKERRRRVVDGEGMRTLC